MDLFDGPGVGPEFSAAHDAHAVSSWKVFTPHKAFGNRGILDRYSVSKAITAFQWWQLRRNLH